MWSGFGIKKEPGEVFRFPVLPLFLEFVHQGEDGVTDFLD